MTDTITNEADWAARISYISAQSQKVFASRRAVAGEWLCTPHPTLEGQTPLEAVATDKGYTAVKDLLAKIEQGIYA